VILGYGVNEGFIDGLKLDEYQTAFGKLIDRIRRLAPQADIAVLGAPDGARLASDHKDGPGARRCQPLSPDERARYNRDAGVMPSHWHGPPNLEAVRQIQRKVALSRGAWYWDWSRVMGGACSIHRWVEASPSLALPDHVHFTAEGAKRIAQTLHRDLLKDP
jgi:lysophospholipase L1-like esterase